MGEGAARLSYDFGKFLHFHHFTFSPVKIYSLIFISFAFFSIAIKSYNGFWKFVNSDRVESAFFPRFLLCLAVEFIGK